MCELLVAIIVDELSTSSELFRDILERAAVSPFTRASISNNLSGKFSKIRNLLR